MADSTFCPADVWVVIPAYNEEATIQSVVQSVSRFGYTVVVVDDGSNSLVCENLQDSPAHVLRHLVNLGQGAALQTGIKYAVTKGARYIVTFDADGQHAADDIEHIIRPIREAAFDVALGSRFIRGGKALNIPKSKLWLLRLAVFFTRITADLQVTDTHNGFRAFSAVAAAKIEITQNGMAHATGILVEIKRLRLRYTEVPVTISYTEYSLTKGQKICNAFNIIWDSMMEIFR